MRTRTALLPLALPALLIAAAPAADGAGGLRSGPMLGYAEVREVAVWVQTEGAAAVKLTYWKRGAAGGERRESSEVKTRRESAYTAVLLADEVEPGTAYDYEVVVDGAVVKRPYAQRFQTLPDWRGRMPPPDLTVAVGGGAYVNDATFDPPLIKFGEGDEIFGTILGKGPQAMIWAGDNVHLREADWGSRTGYLKRYSHARANPALQPLLASVHHYAAWAQHDYGPPGSTGELWNKDVAREAFRTFWPNPSHGVAGLGGTGTTFRWSDVDFFVLDARYHRRAKQRIKVENRVFGDAQTRWLIEALGRSQANFKVVISGCPIVNPVEIEENLAYAAKERADLFEELQRSGITGLFFVAGGRRYGELSRLQRSNGFDLLELTVPPLTRRPNTEKRGLNYYHVPGTATEVRAFALLRFHGEEEDRILTVSAHDTAGNQLWSEQIPASSLR